MTMRRFSYLVLLTAIAVSLFGCGKGCGTNSPTVTVGAYAPQSTDANVQPVWCIDPQNVSGCATDNPQSSGGIAQWGTSCTCANGNGPLASWYGLNTQRWGCGAANAGCPKLRQNTTITFASSHTNNSDPVYFKPLIENGAFVMLQGALPTASQTGTALSVTAKNRATPTILKSTFTLTAADGGVAPSLAVGELIVNATHPSRNWVYTNGSPAGLTTPLTAEVLPASPTITPAEVTTWANSDAVSIYTPVNVNIAQISPVVTDLNQSTFNNQLIVYNLNFFDPGAVDPITFDGSGYVQVYESAFSRTAIVNIGSTSSVTGPVFTNCIFNGSVNVTGYGGGAQFASPRFIGGAFLSSFQLNGANVDADAIVAQNNSTIGSGNLGTVYVESAKTLQVSGPVGSASSYNTNTPVEWGAGTVNVTGTGRLGYPAGAGKAVATLTTTGLQINGQTKYLTVLTSSATGIVTGNTTLTAAALDASFGATSGCALGFGANICNVGP